MPGIGVVGRAVHAVARPVRAGGDDDVLGAVIEDVVEAQSRVADELDVLLAWRSGSCGSW